MGSATRSGDYEVLATIYDGTKILVPKCKSEHFTTEDIQAAVKRHFAAQTAPRIAQDRARAAIRS